MNDFVLAFILQGLSLMTSSSDLTELFFFSEIDILISWKPQSGSKKRYFINWKHTVLKYKWSVLECITVIMATSLFFG